MAATPGHRPAPPREVGRSVEAPHAARVATGPPQPAAAQAPPREPAPPLPAATPPAAAPQAWPAIALAQQRASTAFTPATSEPTVHVTIGRIDVAAPAPPLSKVAAPPSAPAPLSLGDYLRERSEGRRR